MWLSSRPPVSSSRTTRAGRYRARRFGLNLESLEARQLLSLGSEFAVNTTTRGAQYDSHNASAPDGRSVIVWTDVVSATSSAIRAQRYDASGVATGPEILVDPGTFLDAQPAVSMDSVGDFVIVWTRTLPGGDRNIEAQTYNSAGTPFNPNPFDVANSAQAEYDPDVAVQANGDFVVVYTLDNVSGDQDIDFQKFSLQGAPQDLGPRIVADSPQPETHASVARTPDGRFFVAYEVGTQAGDHDIILKQFSGGGGTVQATTTVASTAADETLPSVAVNNDGNAVVAWQVHEVVSLQPVFGFGSSGGPSIDLYYVQARRVPRSGLMQPPGPVINIAGSFRTQAFDPVVVLKRGTHDAPAPFAVAYDTSSGLSFSDTVGVTEVSAADTIQASYVVGAHTAGPALSIDNQGDYVLSYTRYVPIPGSFVTDTNIRARRGLL
jgi:hypothetical protein